MRDKVRNEYFEYLYEIVTETLPEAISFRKLLTLLHNIPYKYILVRDKSRAVDGEYMRTRYCNQSSYFDNYELVIEYLDGPASVLEVLIALAIKIEDIASNMVLGDRTEQWFWEMMATMGINGYSDNFYDEDAILRKVDNFLEHKYAADGTGGAIRIPYTSIDMRNLDLWAQANEFIKHRM